jgi:2-dehydro-3-deoxyphosphogluconate aldolase/(4S)-4-hydroxy-2-oxoglutarate aldolase
MKPASRVDVQKMIEQRRAVAVVRLDDAAKVSPVLDALAAGGVRTVEITMTTPGVLQAVAALIDKLDSQVLIGAGSVLDAETARLAILAGARFVVGPTLRPAVVELCHRYDVLAIPGAYTPTEILSAWEAGADLVKVFPAAGLGPGYVKNVLAPLPQVRLLMTGGVTTENAAQFLDAGAVAVGVGGALVDREAVARGDYARITEEARRLTSVMSRVRERSG